MTSALAFRCVRIDISTMFAIDISLTQAYEVINNYAGVFLYSRG